MVINRLSIRDIRNLHAVDINPCKTINFFSGVNGSGKTSVLEGISLIAHGRSFRSHLTSPIIRFDCDQGVVYSEVIQCDGTIVSIGVQKERKGLTSVKVNKQSARQSSELARYLPIQVIDADSFSLISGAPSIRRKFFDWLVFHVEHPFLALWQRYTAALKQRNSLLRRGKITYSDLEPWDAEMVSQGEQLHEVRARTYSYFKEAYEQLSSLKVWDNETQNIDLVYKRGWSEEETLSEALKSSFERDLKSGTTHIGPHRADLWVRSKGRKVSDWLSRGQQKTLVVKLFLSIAEAYSKVKGTFPVFLLDDLPAELDKYHREELLRHLVNTGGQVFITGIEVDDLTQYLDKEPSTLYKMFHVEHGTVTERKS
ncbi:DNA replication/repair protein RecF [Marinibactrum halimedae]|uniref:DNA replication and repair protein RecF n=1 Tax=Marinibactrum halimedae TaxID=1444977 RepID=A0AA37TDH8_9GAMM|nr:DNA replication/repair protein RecF [Marinibactrum halimedae]MCD9460021.1 DNA replication/repair protein RecF [Marinibactrum halimedae]GLS28211.1 DNA replication and repair protein RecF [Marinibactrum halimedae]